MQKVAAFTMAFLVKTADLLIRTIPPPRMEFAIGAGQSLFPEWMRVNVEVRMVIENDDGRSSWGCAADWPSVGWLDKRPDVPPKQKLAELLLLVELARDVWVGQPPSASAFGAWWTVHERFRKAETVRKAVPLCAAFASALLERAWIDAVCRLHDRSFFEMLRTGSLGFDPSRIHPGVPIEIPVEDWLPESPLRQIHVRHTVGLTDLIRDDELNDGNRIGDGLPQTLEQYVHQQGIRYFKIKVCGEQSDDLQRLERIWQVIGQNDAQVTLDGNESFSDVAQLSRFIDELKHNLPELFQQTLFLEQPLPRAATFDQANADAINKVAQQIPMIIDEADGTLSAFRDAVAIGFRGVSHKNCKGVFKSLANAVFCAFEISAAAVCFRAPKI